MWASKMERGYKRHLQAIEIYKPGKPLDEVRREYGLDRIVKLASNENPFGPSPLAVEAMRKAATQVHMYPDGPCTQLRSALAEKLKLPEEWFIFTNGSNELIELLCGAYLRRGEKAILPHPTFSVYYNAVTAQEGEKVIVPLCEDFSFDVKAIVDSIDSNTRIVFISNPNNPTGTYMNTEGIKAILSKLPDEGLVFMDEAYAEFVEASDYPSGSELLKNDHRIVVSRTFSKAYGLAGLRIGYGIARPEVIEGLERLRQPFNVNAMAQAAALAALRDEEHLKKTVENNRTEKIRLVKALEGLGLRPVASQANFILVDTGYSGEEIFALLLQKGVIVRYLGPELPTHIRVTIGTPEENDFFLSALRSVLESMGT